MKTKAQKKDVPKTVFIRIADDKTLYPATLLQIHASLHEQRIVGEYELKRVLLLEDAVSQWSEI